MSVDLRNYVQVNIKYHEAKPLNRTRDTAVLFTVNTTSSAPQDKLNTHIPENSSEEVNYFISLTDYLYAIKEYNDQVVLVGDYYAVIYSGTGTDQNPYIYYYYLWASDAGSGTPGWLLKDPDPSIEPTSGTKLGTLASVDDLPNPSSVKTVKIVDDEEHPVLYNFVKCFFANGGIKLRIIGGFDGVYDPAATSGNSSNDDIGEWILDELVKLSSSYIVITSDCPEAALRGIINNDRVTKVLPNGINASETVSTLSGYNEKLFISSAKVDDVPEIESKSLYPNYLLKIGPKGIEMSAAAFFTQVDINNSRTISDYCYTIEDVSMFDKAVIDDNDTMVNLVKEHFNIDTTLVNNIRNVMGDTVAGYNAMNYYMRIILTQTLTDRIVNVLATKIKFDKSGINKVINAMTQELNIYKSNGYLNTEYIWTNDDLYYSYNGVDYLICSRNTPLSMGYKFVILPLTALTEEQRNTHVFPPIYVIIADSLPIRVVVINGDAF